MAQSTTEARRPPLSATSWTAGMVWAGSLLIAGLAWIPIVQQSRGMWSILGTMGMPLGAFLVFWTLMVVAMMGPSFAPIASLQLETVRLQPPRVAHVGAFVTGYFLVWTAFGLPVFGLAALEGYVATSAPPVAMAARPVVLVVAGVYQLTPLQARCLASCNQHLGAHVHLTSTRSPLQTVRAGFAHGMDCLGACGGCMLAFVAVGLMNVPWMVALTLIVFVEKLWRYGDHLAPVVGVVLVLFGILAIGDPRMIPAW